mmetsp:Transcript_14900/g.22417  ORF Transcript_14900/g.22417 Transcript_14900/m.22417 type:complete len:592 (+) Transcript_14900:89-1864(+)
MSPPLAPKAAGCLVTVDDIPRVFATLSAYGAQLGTGSCSAMVGMALPYLALQLNVSVASLGPMFAFCGAGYFCGIYLSARAIDKDYLVFSKIVASCICICLSAIASFSIIYSRNIYTLGMSFFAQYMGFGGVDNFSTIAIAEMWGQRVQPWMQAKSAVYSTAGILPALLFSSYGMNKTYILCICLCCTSLIGIALDWMYTLSLAGDIEQTDRASGCSVSESSSILHSMDERMERRYSRPRTGSAGSSLLIAVDDEVLASELLTLEHTLDHLSEKESLLSVDTSTDLVTNILDATAYCNVSSEQRQDPNFEPEINKTLSFATSRIAQKVESFAEVLPDPTLPAIIHVTLVPTSVCILLASMTFVYLGLASAYAGWIPSYVLISGMSSDPSDIAHVSSLYYMCGAVGCILSVPLSVWFSTTSMMRFHLAIIGASIITLLFMQSITLVALDVASALMGYGLSAIIPLTLTVVNDYGLTMDPGTTGVAIMGAAAGAAIMPTLVGCILSSQGAEAVIMCCTIMGITLIAIYVCMHVVLLRHTAENHASRSYTVDGEQNLNSYQRAQTMLAEGDALCNRGNGTDVHTYQTISARERV